MDKSRECDLNDVQISVETFEVNYRETLEVELNAITHDDLMSRLALSSKEVIVHSPVAKAVMKNGVFQKERPIKEKLDATPESKVKHLPHQRSLSKLQDLSPTTNGPQDVTMEPAGSIPFSFGLWSPGKTSPLRGRNMKEYEEQLEHLKKENFALKLRIYFLDERIGSRSFKEDKEELHKANIELKVETESLKKELCDKQELVRQAAALLTSMEGQFKDQLQAAHARHEKETQHLKATIADLQKSVDDYSERAQQQEGAGDLTRLCGLAFSTAEDESNSLGLGAPHTRSEPTMIPAKLQGVFSLPDGLGSPTGKLSPENLVYPPPATASVPQSAQNRIQELEDEVDRLTTKVRTLEDTLQDKERQTQALEEDIANLKKEIEEREDKMSDLEMEVTEKDQKVDQLMQELETRHLEIEAKDSAIQTLHEDLKQVEPQIEVKVQEIIQKDKIIEEKKEQLQQQNKILVEIQITLDEKEKQIAELEESLLHATQKAEKLDKDFSISLTTIQDISKDLIMRDKEIAQLKKELKRKEKKVKDLLAELKEALDMLKKAKWEAETSGGQDGVKEMVEEENERLWAELEQRKLDLTNLRAVKDGLSKTLEEKEEALKKLREELEQKISGLERTEEPEGERDKVERDSNLASLKEMLNSRDRLLKNQEALVEAMKGDLAKTREELFERKEELRELKKELSKKNFDLQDFITKELLGKSNAVKDLQDKLLNLPRGQDNPLEALKIFLETNPLRFNKEQTPKPSSPSYVKSNSLTELNVRQTKDSEPTKEGRSSPQPTARAGRSNSFSLLENALYAQMGQKVYNTNQTFNTYVLSGEPDAKSSDPTAVVPAEALKMAVNSGKEVSPSKTFLAGILNKEENRTKGPVVTKTAEKEPEKDVQSEPQHVKLSDSALQLLYKEVNTIRNEAKALRKDREILSEKVSALQSLNEQLTSNHQEKEEKEVVASKPDRTTPEKESISVRDGPKLEVSDVKGQIEILKGELKGMKQRVTLQMLQLASSKYQESLKNYKQEIISLRKRLADSHNACDLLRNRLEELVDFLEQILDMDKKGIISLSHLSTAQRASLQKSLDDSRSLSHSLSHSLMIGTDSLLGDTLSLQNDEEASRFCFPLENLPLELNFSQFENSIPTNDSNVANLPDISPLDPSNDMMYHSFAAKIVSQVDSKTQEIDDVVAKLTQFICILEMKDNEMGKQVETVLNLRNQVAQLQEELKQKDKLLILKGMTSVNHLTRVNESNLLGNDANDSNRSLHLSSLQHSFPSPTIDSRLYEGIFITPAESSGSEMVLPPPLGNPNSQEEGSSSRSTGSRSSLVDTRTKQATVAASQNDLGAADSKDRSPKGYHKPNGFTTKAALNVASQTELYRTSLEQLALPPSFALASPSESEAWSEPDRNVSLARIGLETCNLISAVGHDRSLSRSRMTRSAPFTSESEGEGIAEEGKEGSASVGTPSTKPKRRTDAAEVKRLSSKLRTVEHLNETLRAELRIYQTLSHNPFDVTSGSKDAFSTDFGTSRQASVEENGNANADAHMKEHDAAAAMENPGLPDTEDSVVIPSSMLQEIRSLRMKLEEAIANNDLLRDQLEAALSGYLSEESRHLTAKLGAVHQELKVNQEKLLVAATVEEQLRSQIKENEGKIFELGERLSSYMTCNQKLEKKISELNVELLGSRQRLANTEQELQSSKAQKEMNEKEVRDSKRLKLESEIVTLQTKLETLQESDNERERKVEEQKRYIEGLEEAKADYEVKLSEQDSAITELCQSITKLQQDNTKSSSVTDQIVLKLQEALQNSESRLLQVTKERFALIGERARLQAQLASVTTHAKLLQREVREHTLSDETSSDSENNHTLQRLRAAQSTILELQRDKELFLSEKQALQKEMQLLQEEVSALRAHLDHVLSRETVTGSREVRELASLQLSYKDLEKRHSSLECEYDTLLSENSSLQQRLREAHRKDVEELKNTVKDLEKKEKELNSQLDAERCLSRNLHIQIKQLQLNSSKLKVPSDPSNLESPNMSPSSEKSSPTKSIKGQHSPLLRVTSSSSWTEDKENRVPPTPHSKGTLSLPLIEDDLTSGDSPDLGIGSDGQFSSLERLGGRGLACGVGSRREGGHFAWESRKEARTFSRLCSEPSHSQILAELEEVRLEREELSSKLASTKESLKEALQQLSRANQKKESVERAIYRQLTKTHDVLRRANGNLRNANLGRAEVQLIPDQHPSTEKTDTG